MLTIYAPSDKPDSKCWEVFDGIKKTWTSNVVIKNNNDAEANSPAMFWGFINNNINLVQQLDDKKNQYWYTDTPYFGRFDNKNLKDDNHYWRICKNNIHAQFVKGLPPDRFDRFKLDIKIRYKNRGKHILVCPSSLSIHRYLKKPTWIKDTVNEIKKHTDRPIKIRDKPRKMGTSGPSVADVPLANDLQDAWACVTSCSISAVEAMLEGVPVFSDPKSFAWPMSFYSLSEIENPFYCDPTEWCHSLAYQQFTPREYADGTAVGILKDLKLL